MKRLCVLWYVIISLKCFSQTQIEPYPLQVGVNKTTNLIFPYEIKSVDRGSRDVLAQKAKGVENVLQVKAGTQNFVTTNLSVITADGKLYSFLVQYASDPAVLSFSFATDSTAHFSNEPFNEAWFENEAGLILRQKQFLHHSSSAELMRLSLSGIYIEKGLLWFRMKLSNHSLIDYHPDYIKFFVQNRHKAKRTAEQRAELEPVYQMPMVVIHGNGKKNLVFTFRQFTLSKDKRLVCQVSEQNGGRLLMLHIGHKTLLKARAPFLPEDTQ